MADIQANEYQQFMALRAQIEQGIENAESEFMLTTYKQLHSVMNRRQTAANKLNIVLQNRAVNQKTKQKREQLKQKRESA
jgi:hypothetical protein